MWILAFVVLVVSQPITDVTLNTQVNGTLAARGTDYYSVQVPQGLAQNAVLIVTVDVENSYAVPEIYLSETEQHPSYSSSDQGCFAEKIGTCATTNPTPGSTMYISVSCGDACNYTIYVGMESTLSIKINTRYSIKFEDTLGSAVVSFTLDQPYTELVLMTEDQDYYANNNYRMLLGIGFVPSENNYSKSCVNIGTFRKAIKLQSKDISVQTTYYLLIEAEEGTSLIFQSHAVGMGEQGTMLGNTTRFDYLTQEQNYSVSYSMNNESLSRPLYIRLKSYSGYGAMTVTYCGTKVFNYYDMDGQSQEIRISPGDRSICKSSLTGLLIQNININVQPFFDTTYSFSIGTSESTSNPEVRFTQLEMGLLGPNESENYTLWLFLQQPTNITLNVTVSQGNPVFTVSQCVSQTSNCIDYEVLQGNSSVAIEYQPAFCTGKCFILLTVVGGSAESQFQFIFKALGYVSILDQSSTDVGFISLNQYIYYNLTLSNFTQVQSITIKMVAYSGQAILIASRTTQTPTLSDLYNSDAIMSWTNVITYQVDVDQPIYLGIFGQTEAVYKISVSVERNQNTPNSYVSLEDKISNDFAVTTKPLLVKYNPHVSPYYLSFYPSSPDCISYGASPPLNNTCMDLPESFSGPIFMNITQVQTDTLKITVSTDVFVLSQSNPLFLSCEQDCYQDVKLLITNSTQSILHSGYGRILNPLTNQTVNNGILNITCPQNQTSCTVTLTAEMYWGSMIVSLASDQVTEIMWYPQPLTYNNMPKILVYRLPKGVPSVITVVSRVASIDMYANLQMLDSSYSNFMSLDYPSKTLYDFKVESDPFKRTTSLEITAELQQSLGCFEDNEICLLAVTIYLNNHSRYIDLVSDQIMLVSASSFTMRLTENVKYMMEDVSKTQYFEFQSALPNNFTFMVEHISNCKPVLVYSKALEFPTEEFFDTKSYHQISFINSTRAVVGVITEEDCIYNIMVALDNNSLGYTTVVEGFPQTLSIGANSTLYVYYQSATELPFQISATYSRLLTYINKIPSQGNPQDYLPNKIKNDYFTSTLPVTINSTSPSAYMIALTNPNNKNISTSLLITQNGYQIILVHNRMYQQPTKQNQTYYYRHYSSDSFKIVFVTTSGSLNVEVYNYGSGLNVTQNINDSTVYPTVDVKADGQMRSYFIQIQALNIGNFTMQIIEDGQEGSPTLSSGIPFFDAFTENPQSNCYKFQGDPISTEPIRVSLIYQEQFINSLVQQNMTLKGLDIGMKFEFQPNSNNSKQQPQLRNHLYFSHGITMSFQQTYGVYSFCFENTVSQTIDQPYYVIVASKQLQYLIPSIGYFVSDSQTQMDKYELVATQPKTIVVQLMNCEGQTQLSGASDFQDILHGQTSDIHETFVSGPYFAGIVNISKGYYYLGAKAVQPNSSYIIRYTPRPQTNHTGLPQMSMSNSNLKWYGHGQNLVVKFDSLKCVKGCNNTLYVKYFLVLGTGVNETNQNARCQIQDPKKPTHTSHTVVQNLSDKQIKFKVSLQKIPDNFVLAVRAEALQNQSGTLRTVYYFYNTTTLLQASDIVFEDDGFTWEMTLLVFIILGMIVLFFVLCLCKKMKIGLFKENRSVEFEIHDFNNSSRDQEVNPEREVGEGLPEIELKEVQKKDTAEGIPYGEFMDQSRI